ncbi:MAG: carbohydrate ABC transporter permease [Clostridiales bacterium]|nr:carbohydrate ABC transporter permease [Clostridiales bacterium]
MSKGFKIGTLVRALVMAACSVIFLFPFLWMVFTSFKTESEMFTNSMRLLPINWTLTNYREVLADGYLSFWGTFWNSVFLAVVNTVGSLFTASLAAFGFAKMRFRGKNILFMFLLATMMIPGQVTLIPMFVIFKNLGMYDTFWPLTLPGIFLYPYGVFLLRQYFLSIPDAYMEAGKLDGAGWLRIYGIIIMPMAVPALVSLMIFKFMGSWNSFMGPMIYLTDAKKYTLPLYVRSLKQDYGVRWTLLMAAATLSVIPTMILYLCGQRFFVEGITVGGIKG